MFPAFCFDNELQLQLEIQSVITLSCQGFNQILKTALLWLSTHEEFTFIKTQFFKARSSQASHQHVHSHQGDAANTSSSPAFAAPHTNAGGVKAEWGQNPGVMMNSLLMDHLEFCHLMPTHTPGLVTCSTGTTKHHNNCWIKTHIPLQWLFPLGIAAELEEPLWQDSHFYSQR